MFCRSAVLECLTSRIVPIGTITQATIVRFRTYVGNRIPFRLFLLIWNRKSAFFRKNYGLFGGYVV